MTQMVSRYTVHVHTNCRNLQKLHIINLSTFNICIMFDRESNKTERISYDIYEFKLQSTKERERICIFNTSEQLIYFA